MHIFASIHKEIKPSLNHENSLMFKYGRMQNAKENSIPVRVSVQVCLLWCMTSVRCLGFKHCWLGFFLNSSNLSDSED